MNQPTTEKVRWTTADLDLFPEDGKRYEIIDGELFVTRAPHWKHQRACEVYRREQGILKLVVTLLNGDELNSPLLPKFNCAIATLFT
jgi:Uma2 family endonuclease